MVISNVFKDFKINYDVFGATPLSRFGLAFRSFGTHLETSAKTPQSLKALNYLKDAMKQGLSSHSTKTSAHSVEWIHTVHKESLNCRCFGRKISIQPNG